MRMDSHSINAKGSLMIQGTTSDAGKSVCVAGLARVLKRRGFSVAPFKPQNMALNSAVTSCGGEIGRAQALQAVACGIELTTDLNPVLLKPTNDMQSQVIIQGKAVSQLDAKTFGNIKSLAFDKVLESYERLQKQYDVILIEGAGSPAEVNLRKNDIANMGFAEAVDCPVVLISDIDRGGVFAHLTGTVNLLSPSEQERIKGFIINKFRGRIELLQNGLDWLDEYTDKTIFGVVPYIKSLRLDAEDTINIEKDDTNSSINVKVPVLPRISNHTDFEPLKWHDKVNLEYVGADSSLDNADLIILPGTKNVRDDLNYIKQTGWDKQIKRHLRYGGKLLAICGGFQMLGNTISDPQGIESSAGESKGLGLLDFSTRLEESKQLKNVSGEILFNQNQMSISGYEIHCGTSTGAALENAFCQLTDQSGQSHLDGAVSEDKLIIGTYVHGLFEDKASMQTILHWVSGKQLAAQSWNETREHELNRLADCYEEHLDIEALIAEVN